MTRMTELQQRAARFGLNVSTWSPGDGVTRYRFAYADERGSGDYFAARALGTTLGIADAETWLAGYASCKLG